MRAIHIVGVLRAVITMLAAVTIIRLIAKPSLVLAAIVAVLLTASVLVEKFVLRPVAVRDMTRRGQRDADR